MPLEHIKCLRAAFVGGGLSGFVGKGSWVAGYPGGCVDSEQVHRDNRVVPKTAGKGPGPGRSCQAPFANATKSGVLNGCTVGILG